MVRLLPRIQKTTALKSTPGAWLTGGSHARSRCRKHPWASALLRCMSPLALLAGPLFFACFAGGCSGSTRTSYPSLYAQWKADADWQKFVRFSWARAHYWTDESKTYPFYGIDDAPIWARINQQDNRAEMENFTGQSPDAVACTP